MEAPVNLHQAIGLVERLINTLRRRIACVRDWNETTNLLYMKQVLKWLIFQFGVYKEKIEISHFEADSSREANDPLSMKCPRPEFSKISLKCDINHYVDEDKVIPKQY